MHTFLAVVFKDSGAFEDSRAVRDSWGLFILGSGGLLVGEVAFLFEPLVTFAGVTSFDSIIAGSRSRFRFRLLSTHMHGSVSQAKQEDLVFSSVPMSGSRSCTGKFRAV